MPSTGSLEERDHRRDIANVNVCMLQTERPSQLLPQCIVEVSDDVLGCLDSDGETNKTIGDAEALSIVCRNPGVRRGYGARDQRFDATQTGGADRQCRIIHEPLRFFDTAFQLEAQHSAVTIEQLAGARMAGMTLQAG